MEPNSLHSVIIDSNVSKRMQLKQATTSLALFKATIQMSELNEALNKFDHGQPLDIVFLSNRFTDEQIKDFVSTAKPKKTFAECAFILVVESGKNDNGNLPRYLLLGIDGFLLEPYSVDRLIETSKIAAKVKKDRSQQRIKAAVEILITDISTTFNALVSFKSADIPAAKIEAKFKKAAATIQTLDIEAQEFFRNRLIDIWSKLEAPEAKIVLPNYSGASSRIKKILEDKVISQLEKEAAKG